MAKYSREIGDGEESKAVFNSTLVTLAVGHHVMVVWSGMQLPQSAVGS